MATQMTGQAEVAPGVLRDATHLAFFDTWRDDVPAGIVVFLVALPLCLGIAVTSGAPLISGVMAGIIGGLVAGALSGSSLMVAGPPPLGRVSGPILAGEGLADEIADRVFERLNGVSVRRR